MKKNRNNDNGSAGETTESLAEQYDRAENGFVSEGKSSARGTTESRPEWYERAEDGPFPEGEGFTLELMTKVEMAAADTGKRKKAGLLRYPAVAFGGAAVLLIAGAVSWNMGWLGSPQETAAVSLPGVIAASPGPSSAQKPLIEPAVFKFGVVDYHIPLLQESDRAFVHAAETTEGIVWSPAPERIENNLDDRATTPYQLFLSKQRLPEMSITFTELSEDASKLLYTLPLTSYIPSADREAYMDLGGMNGLGPYVIYATSARIPGAAQPSEEKLWVLDTRSATAGADSVPKELISFHSSGGRLFSYGWNSERRELVYIYSQPNGDGEYDNEAAVYHLDTGKTEALDQFSKTSEAISYTINGEVRATDRLIW
ncbi:hypothetical protein [Paenibacillus donghaensis]|uniref:Uncharacterized protein n=1 Tax=Paenibacillus donghaensis TaxID=414771 RepID=A0A2Z2KHS0_9BACL|nr:hypothetical protein [Paenibacillus donghaensis]ASA21739.1 hypothetical protein B9T62_13750 [Paenibacillus donghaensis]